MFTVCPKCALTLVVTAADLRIAQGYVRCGRCSSVFNALARLRERQGRRAPRPRPQPLPPRRPPARPRGCATACGPGCRHRRGAVLPRGLRRGARVRCRPTDVNSVFVEAPRPVVDGGDRLVPRAGERHLIRHRRRSHCPWTRRSTSRSMRPSWPRCCATRLTARIQTDKPSPAAAAAAPRARLRPHSAPRSWPRRTNSRQALPRSATPPRARLSRRRRSPAAPSPRPRRRTGCARSRKKSHRGSRTACRR